MSFPIHHIETNWVEPSTSTASGPRDIITPSFGDPYGYGHIVCSGPLHQGLNPPAVAARDQGDTWATAWCRWRRHGCINIRTQPVKQHQ